MARAAEPYEATLQHLENIHAKIVRLEDVRREAEEQLFESMRRDHAAGDLDDDDLVLLRGHLADRLPLPIASRWDAALPIKSAAAKVRARNFHKFAPNGPDGNSWVGRRRGDGESCVTREGVSVVYVLYDAANEPIYVGSTANLRNRLSTHENTGMPWVAYMAVACPDREQAYLLEEQLLRTRMPLMNRKACR